MRNITWYGGKHDERRYELLLRFVGYRTVDTFVRHELGGRMRPLANVWSANAILQGWRNLDGEPVKKKPQSRGTGFEEILKQKETELVGGNENGTEKRRDYRD